MVPGSIAQYQVLVVMQMHTFASDASARGAALPKHMRPPRGLEPPPLMVPLSAMSWPCQNISTDNNRNVEHVV